jgi:hypothetical protein
MSTMAREGSQDFAVTRPREGSDRTDDCDACTGHHRQVIAGHIGRCRTCAMGSSCQQRGLAAGAEARGGRSSENTDGRRCARPRTSPAYINWLQPRPLAMAMS